MTEHPDLCTHAYFAFGGQDDFYEEFWHDGQSTPIPNEQASQKDFQFDIASLNKALVTTPLVFKYLNSKLNNKVKDLFDFSLAQQTSADFCNEALVIDLLRHTSGLPAWKNFWINQVDADGASKLKSHRQITEHIDRVLLRAASCPTNSLPGSYLYSDVGFLFLQRLLEQDSGKSMEKVWKDFCSSHPEFAFLTPSPDPKTCIPSAYCKLRKDTVVSVPHDENAYVLGGLAGHAGCFASGPDLVRLVSRLAKKEDSLGLLDFVLEPKSSDQPEFLNGWQASTSESSRVFGHGNAAGHLGFTGCCFWVEPGTQGYFVLLTNRTYKRRLDPRIQELRAKAANYSWQSLTSDKAYDA